MQKGNLRSFKCRTAPDSTGRIPRLRTDLNALNEIKISKGEKNGTVWLIKTETFARLDRITSQLKSNVILTLSITNEINSGNVSSLMKPNDPE